MSTGHARLSPSNARWPKCPGSVREEANYADIPGEAAIDGTGSHLLLEMCLDNSVLPIQYEGQIIGANHEDNPNGWLIHKDRIDRVQVCLDYVKRRYDELKALYPNAELTIEAESRSDPGGMFGRDDWSGTCDITITVMDGTICVFIEAIDYKDGRGWVNAAENTQLIAYLGGKARKFIASGPELVRPFRPERVKAGRMTIVQPKTMPPIRYENIETRVLVERLEDLRTAARKTDDPDAPLIPGKHCQWCKHNPKRGGSCTAQGEQSLKVVETMSNEVTKMDDQSLFETIQASMGNLTSLESNKLTELADAKDGMMAIFKQIEDEIERRIDLGEMMSGYGMLPGWGSKKWTGTPEEVEKFLKGRKVKKDLIYPAKLLSPAQALKLDLTERQKKDLETKLIAVVAGKNTLTKVSRDTQAPDENKAELMFGDVTPAVETQTEEPVSFF